VQLDFFDEPAIVTWFDRRSGNEDIYAQRISAGGTVQWIADGVALCTATASQQYPTILSDGASGAIVTWQDFRSGTMDIYAQRISADGTIQWTANGVALCTATGGQYEPKIDSDGGGGAIVTWDDSRGGNYDIYAQRISAGGTVQWTVDGVVLCTATGDQEYPTIAPDGAGGAIVTWQDYRSGNHDIYAQRVQGNGQLGGDQTLQFWHGSEYLNWAPGYEYLGAYDDNQHAVDISEISWRSSHTYVLNDSCPPAVALGVDPNGGHLEFALNLLGARPSRAPVVFAVETPSKARVRLAIYDVLGRRVRILLDEEVLPGRRELHWDGRGATGDVVGSGIYFARLTAAAGQRVSKVVLLR
jgi:hypothetical protein